ncbi:VWA domain-containing protein [Nocardioides sp. CBS4Y-1]|uniref:VWA domain-containing protein n=1 Tax=Nocardioides acrostichi TaxID=2784339 RepID=A0A930Y5R8_9ACTN|nr:VWA domain-containing protein [Nocardioides acrostichi]
MTTDHPAEEILLGFAAACRAAGVPVTPDRSQAFLQATVLVGAENPRAVRAAGHATLCATPEDLVRHDQVFEAWFDKRGELPRTRPAAASRPVLATMPLSQRDQEAGESDDLDDDLDDDIVRAMSTDAEVLRRRDVASLTPGEKARLAALFDTLPARAPRRRTSRHQRWHRGQVDARHTVRASLRRLGEPAEIAWRRRATRPRRVVLLVDVSGSMSGYADALLRLAHRLTQTAPGHVETFTVGTRLTHLTRALRSRDAERALVAAGQAVPDWSGGTRLGETLAAFGDRYGRRGMARGAVVVVFSDGWERGDPSLLAEQVARLHRLAHRVVWVNPHRGKSGYEPVQAGVVAVLPHVDDFLAGHSLATYSELCEVIARA